jgi:hypothetical protein
MKNRHLRRLCGILAGVLLAFAMTATMSASDTGIEGVISVSPARPGPQRIGEPDKVPVGNIAFVVKQGEQKVASFTTDATGHFRVILPPGHYVVTREGPGTAIGHWHFEVDVASGKMASVNWTGDSGMR